MKGHKIVVFHHISPPSMAQNPSNPPTQLSATINKRETMQILIWRRRFLNKNISKRSNTIVVRDNMKKYHV